MQLMFRYINSNSFRRGWWCAWRDRSSIANL